MKTSYAVFFLLPILVVLVACSPKVDEVVTTPVPIADVIDEVAEVGDMLPPLISTMPPQPPGPTPQSVQTLTPPANRMPTGDDGVFSLEDAKRKSQFYVTENRSPINNGSFERWEKQGPIHWNGNYSYKEPDGPPEADVQMFPENLDGEWAFRLMSIGTYLEIWQDLKLPEMDGGIVIQVIAYARNPVPKGFAIRLTYATPIETSVVEVYPAEADNEWTRYKARIELPANVGRDSVRLYMTRDSDVRGNVIVDGVSVSVVGVTGIPAASPSSRTPTTPKNH